MIKRALISVFNKEGILDFSKFLSENGVEIIKKMLDTMWSYVYNIIC